MKIKERIKETLDKEAEHPGFKKLAEFYEQMRRAGVVLKKPYDLPPLDTVGREFYKELISQSAHIPS